MAKPLQSGDPPQIGDWKLLGRLGEGGMGVVYLGQRTVNGITSEAAIKVIRDAGQSGGEWERSVLRFKREIDALLRLDVAGAVSIIAADLASRPMWYASDYVDGAQDLHEYVRSHGPLDPADSERLAHELTATQTEVHDRGIVHRDIKPNKHTHLQVRTIATDRLRHCHGSGRTVLLEYRPAPGNSHLVESRAVAGRGRRV